MLKMKGELPKTITLINKNNLKLEVSALGATILGLKVPDKNRKHINVVVGLSKADDYQSESYLKEGLYLGSLIGRCAGRISKGYIEIEKKKYNLYNEEGVHLHGGKEGFDKKIWNIESIKSGDSPSVTLSYISEHLEEGYPGNLKVIVTYTLTEENALKISYKAETDQTTILNLTNHSYFNLDGESTILDHKLKLNSSSCLDLNEQLVPSGKINLVEGTRFDYTKKTYVGKEGFKGLDDIFVLNENDPKAFLSSEKTGIQMKVFTNQPALVIYTPNKFNKLPFKDNAEYSEYPAICFEAQKYPDAIHKDNFPSIVLKPGQTYNHETIYEFQIPKK